MPDTRMVKIDHGAINDRILAKQRKADFRHVEAASVKMTAQFTSAEAKRMFVRYFSTLQLNSYFISAIARTKLEPDEIEGVEEALRKKLEAVSEGLNQAIDRAELLFKNNGITNIASYDTRPLELEIGIISWSGRRFFELLNKFDQLMPLLQTLEIHEVITPRAADIQRADFKHEIRSVAGTVRHLASRISKRMSEVAAEERARAKAAEEEAKAERAVSPAPPAAGVADKQSCGIPTVVPIASAITHVASAVASVDCAQGEKA